MTASSSREPHQRADQAAGHRREVGGAAGVPPPQSAPPEAEAEALAAAILDVPHEDLPLLGLQQHDGRRAVRDLLRPPSRPLRDLRRRGTFNIQTIEQTPRLPGRSFHVLLGALSPLRGIGPQDIDVAGLIERVRGAAVREVIVATTRTWRRGDRPLHRPASSAPPGVRTTRLAFGLPVGGDLEYADQVTMAKAAARGGGRSDVGSCSASFEKIGLPTLPVLYICVPSTGVLR